MRILLIWIYILLQLWSVRGVYKSTLLETILLRGVNIYFLCSELVYILQGLQFHFSLGSKEGIKWTKWKGHWVKNGVFGIMGHKFGPFMAKFLDLNLFSPENVIFYWKQANCFYYFLTNKQMFTFKVILKTNFHWIDTVSLEIFAW